jgi:transcriptional regulator with XRE-family HTH domain
MGGTCDVRDRDAHLTIEQRRLTLIEPVFPPVPDLPVRGRPQGSHAGFGSRLRRERERRRIPLASIAANTKISLTLLQGLERGDVSRWPSGIFRRSFIRAYAESVGLDADVVAREFLEHFQDPAEPPRPVSADAAPARAQRASGETGLRLTLADDGGTFTGRRILVGTRRRLMAVAWDVSLLTALGLALSLALNQFWMPLAVAMLGYYVTSILLLGNTPGVSLSAARQAPRPGGRSRPVLTSLLLSRDR